MGGASSPRSMGKARPQRSSRLVTGIGAEGGGIGGHQSGGDLGKRWHPRHRGHHVVYLVPAAGQAFARNSCKNCYACTLGRNGGNAVNHHDTRHCQIQSPPPQWLRPPQRCVQKPMALRINKQGSFSKNCQSPINSTPESTIRCSAAAKAFRTARSPGPR